MISRYVVTAVSSTTKPDCCAKYDTVRYAIVLSNAVLMIIYSNPFPNDGYETILIVRQV